MRTKGLYLSKEAIEWALAELSRLPKNQLLLFYMLALAVEPTIDRTGHRHSPFQNELERYIGGPLQGGGTAIFNPLENSWRSEEYIQSTVFGRLLNGSHVWTESTNGYIKRVPSRGWPARFVIGSSEMKNLKMRTSPPNLKAGNRIPQTAMAIWYFKFDDLSEIKINSIEELRDTYLTKIRNANKYLVQLFDSDETVFWGDPFQTSPLSNAEQCACFPRAPYSSEPKQSVQLYTDDIKRIKTLK